MLIDEKLLADAMQAIGARTRKEAIRAGLEALEMVKTRTSLREKAYDLVFRLRREGITVPYTDILIFTSAIAAAASVVHADSHFDLMGPHCGLRVESFVKATKKVKK